MDANTARLFGLAIGYIFAALVGHILIKRISLVMNKKIGEDSLRSTKWQSEVLGVIERIIYIGLPADRPGGFDRLLAGRKNGGRVENPIGQDGLPELSYR